MTRAFTFAWVLLASAAYAVEVRLAASAVEETPAELVVRVVAARQLPPGVAPGARPALDEVVRLLRTGKVAQARERWIAFVPVAGLRSTVSIDELIQWVLRQSYLETTEDLRSYADKVRYYNDLKREIREELSRARDGRAVRSVEVLPYRPDGAAVATRPPRDLSGAARDRYVRSLEARLQGAGESAQLADLDLQSVLQKEAQLLAMISNAMKMLHDTATAIIGNLR